MMDPDGVINGYSKCNGLGQDLNTCWDSPSESLHSTVYHIKRLMSDLHTAHRLIGVFDLKSHNYKDGISITHCPSYPSPESVSMQSSVIDGGSTDSPGPVIRTPAPVPAQRKPISHPGHVHGGLLENSEVSNIFQGNDSVANDYLMMHNSTASQLPGGPTADELDKDGSEIVKYDELPAIYCEETVPTIHRFLNYHAMFKHTRDSDSYDEFALIKKIYMSVKKSVEPADIVKEISKLSKVTAKQNNIHSIFDISNCAVKLPKSLATSVYGVSIDVKQDFNLASRKDIAYCHYMSGKRCSSFLRNILFKEFQMSLNFTVYASYFRAPSRLNNSDKAIKAITSPRRYGDVLEEDEEEETHLDIDDYQR